jgi:acetyl esterase
VSEEEYYKDSLRAFVRRVEAPQAVVALFHGGGWVFGDPRQFDFQQGILAEAGIASVSIEYRVKHRHNTMVGDAVVDAIDAGAYVRREFPRSPIFFCGASAGGLLAVHCAVRHPAAGVILLNPVLDLSPDRGFRSKAVPSGGSIDLSPLHIPLIGFPSTLIMHDTKDAVVPISVSREFADKLNGVGSRARVQSYASVGHGFFNVEPARTETCSEIKAFIYQEIGRSVPT